MNEEQLTEKKKIITFLISWFAKWVSLFGTNLSGFAIGVNFFQETRSTITYALIIFVTMIPEILLAPIAGVLVDRMDRRLLMIIGHAGSGICMLVIALLSIHGQLNLPAVLILLGICSTFNSIYFPVFGAVTTLLVPSRHLGRANGLLELGFAVAQILTPALAGFLLLKLSLGVILSIDVATYVFAVIVFLLVRFPNPPVSKEGMASRGSFMKELRFGWTYIWNRPGLFGLLMFFSIINFFLGMVETLFIPLVLGFADSAVLGTVMSVGGVGMLLGSMVMIGWGGPKRKIYGILGFSLIQGLCLFLPGYSLSIPIVTIGCFCYMFVYPLIGSCSSTIWQKKVPTDIQGRVFSFRAFVVGGSMALASLVSGPLADFVFEPLMMPGGRLANVLGPYLGTGQGRGVALLIIVIGIITLMTVLFGFLNPRLRNLELELPDYKKDDELPPKTRKSLTAELPQGLPGIS